MENKSCPHCTKALPTALVWRTLFAGQTAHACPHCRKRFRLTYPAKQRVGWLNLALLLGFVVLVGGFAPLVAVSLLAQLATVYLVAAAMILLMLPRFARYEKLTAPPH